MSGAMPNDQPVPPFNDKIDLSGISLNVAQMGNEIEIPKLAFEMVLNNLSLKNVISCRRVSKSWYRMIDGFGAKSLCYSKHPSDFILGKKRWLSGAFAQNFISSSRFESSFKTFGPKILSNLKHLRLCDLDVQNKTALNEVLNSFDQLEELNVVQLKASSDAEPKINLYLNLPMLNNIHFDDARVI